MPSIKNPVLPSETFDRHWDQEKYANFRQRMHENARKAREAYNAKDKEASIKLWQNLLGEEFGKGSGGNGGGGNRRPRQPQSPGNSGSQRQGRVQGTVTRAATAGAVTPPQIRRPGEARPFG